MGATAETQCVVCPEGKSSPTQGALSSCETCASGTYAPGEGFASCSTCNPGTSCGEGATEMVTCQAGSASGAGSASCGLCPAGFYSSTDSASACLTCDAGKYCEEGATTMLSCPKGTYSNFGANMCSDCAPSTIAPVTSSMACSACDLYQVASDDRTECVCQQGYYVGQEANQALPVPDGVSLSTPGMTLETLNILPGFWRTSPNSTEVLACLNADHCQGGNKTTDFCSDGNSGPLCAVCASGYAATGSGELLVCTECTGQSIFAVVGGLALVFVLLALLLFVVFKRTGEKTRETVRSRTSTMSDMVENVSERMDKIAPIAKIVAAYFQVAGGLGMVYGLVFPKFFTNFSSYIGALSD